MTAGSPEERACPHCRHDWALHSPRCNSPITQDIRVGRGTYDPIGVFYRSMIVDVCGCMWAPPQPSKPPPAPPTAREQAVERVRLAIYAELDRQHEADEIEAAGYWDDEWGRLDGEPDWNKVAAAALDASVSPGECQVTAGGTTEEKR